MTSLNVFWAGPRNVAAYGSQNRSVFISHTKTMVVTLFLYSAVVNRYRVAAGHTCRTREQSFRHRAWMYILLHNIAIPDGKDVSDVTVGNAPTCRMQRSLRQKERFSRLEQPEALLRNDVISCLKVSRVEKSAPLYRH